ncbi:hypothetical protein C8J56DRAFT_802528 [Mycena floridula]|nr:hypothetical protein C8J56DRAFT_802528 [Mycena floridula]
MHARVKKESDILDRKLKQKGVEAITPEFIDNFLIADHAIDAPETTAILLKSMERKYAVSSKLKDPKPVVNIILEQVLFQCSSFNCGFAGFFGIFMWANGAPKQVVDALYRCRLSMSYSFVLRILTNLGNRCVKRAIDASRKPHLLNYDNLNIETSIFIEQREDGPVKVTSGTFGMVLEACNATHEDMLLAPILQRLKCAPTLRFKELEPSCIQRLSFAHQLQIHVIRILPAYSESFSHLIKRPKLQFRPRRPLPHGHKTRYFPLQASTTEENDIDGNLALHDKFCIEQLQFKPEELNTHKRQILQIGWAAFHAVMNLIWLLLNVHRGSLSQIGSLSYFFAILDKKRLAGEKPDFHTLLAALTQITDGILVNAWLSESGHVSLESFAKSLPTDDQLLKFASSILMKHATPIPLTHPDDFSKDKKPPAGVPQPEDNIPR